MALGDFIGGELCAEEMVEVNMVPDWAMNREAKLVAYYRTSV
jgi:hypothetical protein